jgi:hypothetical protein
MKHPLVLLSLCTWLTFFALVASASNSLDAYRSLLGRSFNGVNPVPPSRSLLSDSKWVLSILFNYQCGLNFLIQNEFYPFFLIISCSWFVSGKNLWVLGNRHDEVGKMVTGYDILFPFEKLNIRINSLIYSWTGFLGNPGIPFLCTVYIVFVCYL